MYKGLPQVDCHSKAPLRDECVVDKDNEGERNDFNVMCSTVLCWFFSPVHDVVAQNCIWCIPCRLLTHERRVPAFCYCSTLPPCRYILQITLTPALPMSMNLAELTFSRKACTE